MSVTAVRAAALSKNQKIETALAELCKSPPKLHRPKDFDKDDDPAAEDGLISWGIQESLLRRLTTLVAPDSLTLETGSGLSTVCFAIIGTEHVCISPAQKEHRRIRTYCAEHDISTDRICFVPLSSDHALPSLDFRGRKLDFALIDGAHRFPEPMIDYYYVNRHLGVGGVLAVDDIDIRSVGLLHDFLITEPAYEVIEIDGLKTGLYRKIGDTASSWFDQRFNAKYPDFSYLPLQTRIRETIRPLEQKLRAALRRIPGLPIAYRRFKARSHNKSPRSSSSG